MKGNEASDALAADKDDHDKLEQTRTRIDRVRRVAPHLQTRNSRIDERDALGDVIVLPEDATEDLNAVKKDMKDAERLWYRCARLFRQEASETGSAMLRRVTTALVDHLGTRADQRGPLAGPHRAVPGAVVQSGNAVPSSSSSGASHRA